MIFGVSSVPDNFLVGLGIKKINQNQNHIAFIYLDRNNIDLRICHLRWHKDLSNTTLNSADYTLCDLFLDDVNKKFLAGALDTIHIKNLKTIPYSFQTPVQVFGDNFFYVGDKNGEGLTCATFVLSVLESLGFKPIDSGTWSLAPEDINWQTDIVNTLTLSLNITDRVHILELEKLIGKATRISPAQVFGCCAVEGDFHPIAYSEAVKLASTVELILNSHSHP